MAFLMLEAMHNQWRNSSVLNKVVGNIKLRWYTTLTQNDVDYSINFELFVLLANIWNQQQKISIFGILLQTTKSVGKNNKIIYIKFEVIKLHRIFLIMLRLGIVCIVLLVTEIDSAKILGVFPTPSLSHQVVFRALTSELAKNGHELVIITPNPISSTTNPIHNIIEIDVSFTYAKMYETINKDTFSIRGLSTEPSTTFNAFKEMIDMFAWQINSTESRAIMDDQTQKFDLIIVETLFNYPLIYSHIFKVPTIAIVSFHGMAENFEAMGGIARHPIYYPHILRRNYYSSGLFNRMRHFIDEFKYMIMLKKLEAHENKVLQKYFGPGVPTVTELNNNIDVMLINSNQMFCDNRPIPPNVEFVGPLHLQPKRKLPEDLYTYLENSKKGVIYISFGTNAYPKFMDKDLLATFLSCFNKLPYNFLWKYDGDDIKDKPKNLRIQKFFPQSDLLGHKNIKLFITQAGVQSIDEAIDAEVPMVAIPLLGDQFYNAHRITELSIGVELDIRTLDEKALIDAIEKVAETTSYRNNIKKTRTIINDHLQTPMERAVWMTEYVLRHRGAKHLRSPIANITYADYWMIDVLVVIFILLTLSIYLPYLYLST